MCIALYDLTGREIAVLVEGHHDAGSYTLTFDSGDLPSGMYRYRLSAGLNTITRTMTVLK